MVRGLVAVVVMLVAVRAGRQKRFLGDHWWRHLHGGAPEVEERSDPEDWGTRLEEEMRPLGETLGGALGGLVQGLVGGLGGAPFHQAVVDRRDGEEVVTGDHTMGLETLLENLGDDLGHTLGHFGSSSFSSSSSFSPSFSSSSSFSSSNMGDLGGMDSFDPFSMFGIVRRKWYEGEGVCTEREVVDEEEVEERNGFGIFQANMRMTQCHDEAEMHECRTEVTEGGVRRTVVERQVCCHGHRRSPGTIGCQEVQLETVRDTVAALGGAEFMAMLESNRLADLLDQNITVFVPSDDAVEDFHRDLLALNTVAEDESDKNKDESSSGIDDGLLSRRRRAPLSLAAPSLNNILLGHMVPGILAASSMGDEEQVATMAEGSKIRLTVYNTFPEKVVMANCGRVTSRDHMAQDGIVHLVDKVVMPPRGTISELLRAELGTATFYTALQQTNLVEELDGEGQFTVFAPTEKALEALDPVMREGLISGGNCAEAVLRNHILPNVICSGIVEGRVKTNNQLNSMLLLARSEAGEVTVEGARLEVRDVMATNGVIHLIDRVLVPDSAKSISASLSARPRLAALLHTSGLADHFHHLSNATLFLPSEEALGDLPDSFLQQVEEEPGRLEELLTHHVVSPQLDEAGLATARLLPSHLANHQIRVSSHSPGLLGRRQVLAQCARVVEGEEVCGATVLTVDKVLLPPTGDILGVISGNPDYSRFLQLVTSTNLTSLLASPARSLLVPTNTAFQALDQEVLDRLEEDEEFAAETVERHLLREVLCCAAIQRNNLLFNNSRKRSVSGHLVSVRRSASGHLYADKAEISKCDMIATNGVVHQLDSLLLPTERAASAQRRTSEALKNIFNFNPFQLF